MTREDILIALKSIWSALQNGDWTEFNIGNLLFLIIKDLEKYWYHLEWNPAQPQVQEIDEIEEFLSGIANL